MQCCLQYFFFIFFRSSFENENYHCQQLFSLHQFVCIKHKKRGATPGTTGEAWDKHKTLGSVSCVNSHHIWCLIYRQPIAYVYLLPWTLCTFQYSCYRGILTRSSQTYVKRTHFGHIMAYICPVFSKYIFTTFMNLPQCSFCEVLEAKYACFLSYTV